MFRLRQVFLVLLIVFSVYGGELTAEESIKGFTQVANDNCGISGGQPHLLSGSNYRYLELWYNEGLGAFVSCLEG